MALRTLHDSPVLAPLVRAAESVGVEAVLFGSVASRALLFDAAGAPAGDLFELAEHVADIDIGHTGPADLTPRFADAIFSMVPLAPWFRWSIVDRNGLAAMENLAHFNVGVPLRQLRLGTRRLFDPAETRKLLRRALRGDIDLLANERFDESPRSTFDSEAAAVLVYVDAAVDVLQTYLRAPRLWTGRGPGQRSPAGNLVVSGVDRIRNMNEPERGWALRRLWYRFTGSALRVLPPIFQEATAYFGLEPILSVLDDAGYPASRLLEGRGVAIVSAHLGDGTYRMPQMVSDGATRDDWNSALGSALTDLSHPSPSDPVSDPIRLAPGNDVVGGLLGIPVTKGLSASSRPEGAHKLEFFHVSLDLPRNLPTLSSANLTAIVIGHGAESSSLLSAYASVSTAMPWPSDDNAKGVREPGRCTVRIGLLDLEAQYQNLDVFLLHGASE